MEKQEILEKAQEKKAAVGEMEKAKINKSNWIALVAACVVAIALMIVEGALGNYSAIYAIAMVCFTWATIFYFCQYFIAKRPKGVLIGAILETVGLVIAIVFYILYTIGVL